MRNMSNIDNTDNILLMNHEGIRRRHSFLLLMFFVFSPLPSLAQFNFDVPTVEALIYDHKRQGSLLIARSVLESANKTLHKTSTLTNKEYKDINVELDKYSRAFDYIDLVYNALYTGFNVYKTYNTIKDRITKCKDLLEDYNEKIISKFNFETADTIILTTSYRAISDVAEECENLYGGLTLIGTYSIGLVPCTTSDLQLVVSQLNQSLDRIRDIINRAYYKMWQYMQARMRYWKPVLWQSKTMRQLAEEAFERWKTASNHALDNTDIGDAIDY